jgi:hypothetical protein
MEQVNVQRDAGVRARALLVAQGRQGQMQSRVLTRLFGRYISALLGHLTSDISCHLKGANLRGQGY